MTVFRGFSSHEKSLFLAGLVIKLVLGTLLASSFVSDLFLPFIAHFVETDFANPYQHFLENGQANAFPYPALMLYVLALPQMLIGHDPGIISHAELFMFRLPLLIADITIFFVLKAWLADASIRRLIWLYWLSPVLIYISYIHGQLDVIPIALLLLSMFFLFRDKVVLAGVLIACALAAKTNVILIFPFFLLYFATRSSWLRDSAVFLVSAVVSFSLINLAYLSDTSFQQMVFLNAEQGKVFLSFFTLNTMPIYIVPAGWFLLMALGARAGLNNRDVFVMFVGFAFCVVLLLIPPQHGWYYWIVPFFSFYFAKETHSSVFAFGVMQLLYLLYFLVYPGSDYAQVMQPMLEFTPELGLTYAYLQNKGFDAEQISNLIFTFLQCSLLLICVQIYMRGLSRYRHHKLTGLPFLIGVGGDSGVGKSTLSDALADVFSQQNVTILRGDDQHRWQRGHEKWKEFTHLDPRANHLHNEINMLRKLSGGRRIYRKHYDHDTGRFTSEVAISPNRLTILEGLHPFFLAEQRDLFDLKIFVSPDDALAVHWKIRRDSEKRNYTTKQVLQQIAARREDSEKFIATQAAFADIVLHCRPSAPIDQIGDPESDPDIVYDITVPNSLHIDPAIEMIDDLSDIEVSHSYPTVDTQKIELSGQIGETELNQLQSYFDQRLQDIGAWNSKWPPSLFGVMLFLLVYCIYERADYARR